MSAPPSWGPFVASALQSMTSGPRKLPLMVGALSESEVTAESIVDHVTAAGVNDPARVQLTVSLSGWDTADEGEFEKGSTARREWVVGKLGLSPQHHERLLDMAPIVTDGAIVISKTFEPWYRDARHQRSTMYWRHYNEYLQKQRGWPAASLESLDRTTTDVVERLSDPQRTEARQTKGLVVGYVQSGKTANFTGVTAKAIDAGYRLVIVLTGTIEVLRAQTQLRMDKELVGQENILDGLDPTDPDVARQLDYQQHEDWLDGRFVSHGEELLSGQAPKIVRLTTHGSDYKRLDAGRTQLRFEVPHPAKALNHGDNLARAGAYVAVVKKNKAALEKLIADIKPFRQKQDLPVLIIDDEADQASVDTTNPSRWRTNDPENRRRTTINKLLSELLHMLPRAQYVGYTATPFANVFIDPDDERDLFPSHFILSLQRPPGYMGVADFHDLGTNFEGEVKTAVNSNEVAHVRRLEADVIHDSTGRAKELGEALDAFVLAGAVKSYRTEASGRSFKHHTMLVHESVKQNDHEDTAALVRSIWRSRGFADPAGLSRLGELWKHDFSVVSAARAGEESTPASFDDLVPHVGKVVARLSEGDPVAVMNSNTDVAQRKVNFDADEVWRVLVGGTQLSRGFTIEGLTTSYFRRRTMQADTLMQAGRWFGFRAGYQDLVRLYIRRDAGADLYDAFGALLQDEESFREELRQYSGFTADGQPKVEPWQVPPLVSQHLPWLKPTARNKMWNARIDSKGGGGRAIDLPNHPDRRSPLRRSNLEKVGLPLLKAATSQVTLKWRVKEAERRVDGLLPVLHGRLSPQEVLNYLKPGEGMSWNEQYEPVFAATYKFLVAASNEGNITGWHVVWPQVGPDSGEWTSAVELGRPVPVSGRRLRQAPRTDFPGSDRKHRYVVERLAGTDVELPVDDAGSDELRGGSSTTGALLVQLAHDNTDDGRPGPTGDKWQDHVVLVSLVLPPAAVQAPSNRIQWSVRVKARDGEAAVEPPS